MMIGSFYQAKLGTIPKQRKNYCNQIQQKRRSNRDEVNQIIEADGRCDSVTMIF
eukprot:COSAG06_NODE_1927_length_8051_cov_7.015342_5_plen_54_part_00